MTNVWKALEGFGRVYDLAKEEDRIECSAITGIPLVLLMPYKDKGTTGSITKCVGKTITITFPSLTNKRKSF